MKLLRKCIFGLLALLLLLVCLLWFFPARWAAVWFESQLHGVQLQQLHGTLWDGRADQVLAADGRPLGSVQWRLSRRSVFGRGAMEVDFDGPRLAFSGDMRRLPAEQMQLRNVRLRTDLTSFGNELALPWGQPQGNLSLTIDQAVLQGGWPLQLEAAARWTNATLRTDQGEVVFGALQARAQASNGVVKVHASDDGEGPLLVDGDLQLSPLGWRLDVTLRPRQTDPVLQRWLATWGDPAADGSLHLRRHGGLAAPISEPPAI